MFLDGARFAARRLEDDGVTPSRVLYETFYAYFLPQLDRLDDQGARQLFELLSPTLDRPEQAPLSRVIRTLLGSGDRHVDETGDADFARMLDSIR